MMPCFLHRRFGVAVVASLVWAGTTATPGAVVLDRILAVVGDRPITLSDVRAALDLEFVDVTGAEDAAAAALEALIERQLMLIEVERYGPEATPDDAIAAAVVSVRDRVGEARYRAALGRSGLTEAVVAVVLRDDLRIERYISQRFGAATQPTDDELARAYAVGRDELAIDGRVPTLAEAAPRLREQIAEQRRRAQVVEWLSGLRRRTEVRLLDAQGGAAR